MRVLWISLFVLVIDQMTKVAVLKHMYLGQQIPVLGDWLKLTFTENPGMAFGITFGPQGMVAIFSILATLLIVVYMVSVRHGYWPYLACLALILGGALGNIIDRVFYGVIFGSGPLFAGKVVDFIHVNVWNGFVPESVPFLGGSYISLFPIWNVADMAIVLGVVGVLVFQNRFHREYLAAAEAGATGTVYAPATGDPAVAPATVNPAVAPAGNATLDASSSAPASVASDAAPDPAPGAEQESPVHGDLPYPPASGSDEHLLDERHRRA